MPFKDVKVNGIIQYLIQKPDNSGTTSNNNNYVPFSNGERKYAKNQHSKEVIFASCFKDGVYRYPTHFSHSSGIGKSN